MGNLANAFDKHSDGRKTTAAETVMLCEENYMKLLKRYSDDIEHISNLLESVRSERVRFYTEQLPAIQQELEKDDVSPQNRELWISNLQDNMEKSFRISESLIEHYVTKNLEQFKNELQRVMENG